MKLFYKLGLSLIILIGLNTTIVESRNTKKTIFNHQNKGGQNKEEGVDPSLQKDLNTKGHAAQEKKLEASAAHHVQGCTVADATKEAGTIAAAILAKKVHKVDLNQIFAMKSAAKGKKAHPAKKGKKPKAARKGKKPHPAKKGKKPHPAKKGKKPHPAKKGGNHKRKR